MVSAIFISAGLTIKQQIFEDVYNIFDKIADMIQQKKPPNCFEGLYFIL